MASRSNKFLGCLNDGLISIFLLPFEFPCNSLNSCARWAIFSFPIRLSSGIGQDMSTFFYFLFGTFSTGFLSNTSTDGPFEWKGRSFPDYCVCTLFHLEATNRLDSNVWLVDMWIGIRLISCRWHTPTATNWVRVPASFDEYSPSMSRSAEKNSCAVCVCTYSIYLPALEMMVTGLLSLSCYIWYCVYFIHYTVYSI
jgi:hypothetical protein